MKLPRNVNGTALIRHLTRSWEYEHIHTVGSHFVLRTPTPHPHTIAVPTHKPLKVGTLSAILQGVAVHKGVQRAAVLSGL